MKRVVLFVEINSDYAYETAQQFVSLPEWTVYALHKSGERKVGQDQIRIIEIGDRQKEQLAEGMERILADAGKIDLLVMSAGARCKTDGPITEPHDYEALLQVVECNVIGNLEAAKCAVELLKRGNKRIALLTEQNSGINLTKETGDFGYYTSLAALNMMEKILFNTFRKEGFTFRCYAYDRSMEGGVSAAEYLRMDFADDPNDAYIHSEENRLVMRNCLLQELPW